MRVQEIGSPTGSSSEAKGGRRQPAWLKELLRTDVRVLRGRPEHGLWTPRSKEAREKGVVCPPPRGPEDPREWPSRSPRHNSRGVLGVVPGNRSSDDGEGGESLVARQSARTEAR